MQQGPPSSQCSAPPPTDHGSQMGQYLGAAGAGSGSGRETENTESSRARTRLASEKVGRRVTKGTLRIRGSCRCRGGCWPLYRGAAAPHAE